MLEASGPEPEIISLHVPDTERLLRVGLLDEEPFGVISTRSPGVVEFEASLEWPPDPESSVSLVSEIRSLPDLDASMVTDSLRESTGDCITTLYGDLRSLDEEALGSTVDGVLRAVTSSATVSEAVLRTRVRRVCRASCPSASAVQALARCLWEGGARVGFGSSFSTAILGADVMVGCQGNRVQLVDALSVSRRRVERAGISG